MILGDGPLAYGARAAFGVVPFTWLLEADVPADLAPDSIVIISHPILIGTTAKLEAAHPHLRFAYVPENVRLDHPEDWRTQARYIIGTRHNDIFEYLRAWFYPGILMSPESAEMTKHALNGFLSLSVLYANEIATLARDHNADPEDVARGLMSDPRIGYQAYLRPKGGLSPHLIREIHNLVSLGGGPLINAMETQCSQ